MLLLLSLAFWSARADESASRGKDSYLDAFMESHAVQGVGGGGSGSGGVAGSSASAALGPYPNPQPQYPGPSPQPQYGAPVSNPQPQYGAPTTSPQPQQYGPPTAQPQYAPPAAQPQYGPPTAQPQYAPPNPQPQYGPPTAQPQYGPPNPQPQYGPPNPQPQYGPPSPQPQYGAPTPYGSATVTATMAPTPFFEGLGAGLWSMLSQLPLPDFHTALKILLKVIVIKGVVKLISLLLVMLFIPKLEDILSMASSLLDVDMDMDMDMVDKPKPAAKPDHHHHNGGQDDGEDMEANDEVAMEDAAMMPEDSGRAGRSPSTDRGATTATRVRGAARSRMLNALAARVEDAVAKTASVLSAPCAAAADSATGSSGQSRCGREQIPPKKTKKKLVKKNE